jgi:hypothetical protein
VDFGKAPLYARMLYHEFHYVTFMTSQNSAAAAQLHMTSLICRRSTFVLQPPRGMQQVIFNLNPKHLFSSQPQIVLQFCSARLLSKSRGSQKVSRGRRQINAADLSESYRDMIHQGKSYHDMHSSRSGFWKVITTWSIKVELSRHAFVKVRILESYHDMIY